MHMVATNLCIWLNVLVEETKHTIHHVAHEQDHHNDHASNHEDHHAHQEIEDDHDNHEDNDDNHEDNEDHLEDSDDNHDSLEDESVEIFDHRHLPLASDVLSDSEYSEEMLFPISDEVFTTVAPSAFDTINVFNLTSTVTSTTTLEPNIFNIKLADGLFDSHSDFHNLVKRGIVDEPEGCRIVNLMGDMVSSSAPLLFPCTIEYSLLCASVLYVMWKNVQVRKSMQLYHNDHHRQLSQLIARKVRHLYSVDCGKASRGLFSGIFFLVWTLISLIVFYVLISESHFKYYGILSANISEIILYSIGIISTIVGMKQIRKLGFIEEEETELDNVLLVIAQVGLYMFTICTLIGGYFSSLNVSPLTLITALAILVQASLQTLYILDGSRRCCKTPDQIEKKHGRDMVTFMLTLNLSMWLFSTFQTSRAYLHKAQQEFYGIWAWTIINHISMPLAIFYRFHATVCLGEIWKRAYKLRNEEDL
ncbi:hypothetical protein Avbf_12034 [Armadillidium vulgare]|nr:hypothetical protein Avbf_12034 [Armadillidium vulgare]